MVNLNRETYDDLIVPYEGAIRILTSHINNYRQQLLRSKEVRNPIDNIYSRVKTRDSIEKKCLREDYDIDSDDIELVKTKILDIAGVRITCIYRDDVYKIKEYLDKIPGVFIREVRDYIRSPKPSGYQSLHLRTLVEVSSATDGIIKVPVEVQIRDLLMQEWAQCEHRARYKGPKCADQLDLDRLLLEATKISQQLDEIYIKIRQLSGED